MTIIALNPTIKSGNIHIDNSCPNFSPLVDYRIQRGYYMWKYML